MFARDQTRAGKAPRQFASHRRERAVSPPEGVNGAVAGLFRTPGETSPDTDSIRIDDVCPVLFNSPVLLDYFLLLFHPL